MAITIAGGATITGGASIGTGGSPSPSPAPGASNFGYTAGGFDGSSYVNNIDKFPFSSDANATDVGDLVTIVYNVIGQNSSTHGYTSGGVGTPATPVGINVIQKFLILKLNF